MLFNAKNNFSTNVVYFWIFLFNFLVIRATALKSKKFVLYFIPLQKENNHRNLSVIYYLHTILEIDH